LPTSDFAAKASMPRSVPALTTEAAVRTRTPPGRTPGAGTSSTVIRPVRASWTTCFMSVSTR
jgi:hypothetical protein